MTSRTLAIGSAKRKFERKFCGHVSFQSLEIAFGSIDLFRACLPPHEMNSEAHCAVFCESPVSHVPGAIESRLTVKSHHNMNYTSQTRHPAMEWHVLLRVGLLVHSSFRCLVISSPYAM